jgi:prenylcysteine oxidase/farnesylcysteine lyase
MTETTLELPVPRVWYTGGIESFISTMETSALMGRNVASLMFQSWQKMGSIASHGTN